MLPAPPSTLPWKVLREPTFSAHSIFQSTFHLSPTEVLGRTSAGPQAQPHEPPRVSLLTLHRGPLLPQQPPSRPFSSNSTHGPGTQEPLYGHCRHQLPAGQVPTRHNTPGLATPQHTGSGTPPTCTLTTCSNIPRIQILRALTQHTPQRLSETVYPIAHMDPCSPVSPVIDHVS